MIKQAAERDTAVQYNPSINVFASLCDSSGDDAQTDNPGFLFARPRLRSVVSHEKIARYFAKHRFIAEGT